MPSALRGFRLLAAASGMIAAIVGAILAINAPCFLVEYMGEGDYSIGPFIPTLIAVVGVFTFASALRGRGHLSPLTSACLGLLITSLTFGFPHEGSIRIQKFGYPLAWLAQFIPPSWADPHTGIIALPFLIDLAVWTLIVGIIIFASKSFADKANNTKERGRPHRAVDTHIHRHSR